jgi:hypothetical protein
MRARSHWRTRSSYLRQERRQINNLFTVRSTALRDCAAAKGGVVADQLKLFHMIPLDTMQDFGEDIPVSDLGKGRSLPALRSRTPRGETGHGGRGINAVAAALVIGAVMLPSLLLGGKLDEVRPVAAKSAAETRLPARRPGETDALRAMEHIARAELPRPVVLALIAPLPLQNLQIAGGEVSVAGEQTQIVSARGGFQPAAKANVAIKVQTPPKFRAPAGTKTLAATAQQNSGTSTSQRFTARPAAQPDPRTAPVPNREAARSIAERKPSASLPGLAGRSVNDLSPEQISRALFDIAEHAGLVEEGESRAFQACVLEKIRGEGAEAEQFWNLVRRCAR